jgi:hypothetical protein
MELVKGEFFEVSGINCSIENPSFVTAVISAAQFRFSRPCEKTRPSESKSYAYKAVSLSMIIMDLLVLDTVYSHHS